MNCIRCQSVLTPFNVNGVEIEACSSGCGGLWFDHLELKKMDEVHEIDSKFLEIAKGWPRKPVDHSARLNCPHCQTLPLMRFFYSVKKDFEVDHCAKCGGYWLDANELFRIYESFETEAERQKAFESLFNQEFLPELVKNAKESERKLKSSQQIASIFRFICPSFYLPGKQDWGGF